MSITDRQKNWAKCTFGDLLDYIQPGPYIVESTDYSDSYQTPVLTAGKSFIKGYTNEKEGIFDTLPVIIFDDFTTATQFVSFPFKVKSSAMKILKPKSDWVNIKYVYYLMQVTNIHKDTHKRYWIGIYSKVELLLPPKNEQDRIVNKIEVLLSELESGIESLKTAREQLNIYRQSLLKHAFEGKLTEQWRKDNCDKLEKADVLLARIQKEREVRYQRQLDEWDKAVDEWENNGKYGRKPAKPRAFDVPAPLTEQEKQELAALPVGWQWSKVGCLYDVYVGATPSRKNQDYWNGEIPWVSSGEVSFCKIKDTEEKITLSGYENTSTKLHPVGTVMLAMIGEGKTRGQPAILDIEATHNQNTAAIRVSETECSSKLFYHYLVYQYELTRKLGSGNNQKALNKSRVSEMIVPLIPTYEQNAIAGLLEAQLSILGNLEIDISENIARSSSLRQSILKKAFSGQLVSQDPSDEPASELLKRIAEVKAGIEDIAKAGNVSAKKAKVKKSRVKSGEKV